jgi:hypothetical protein
MVVGGQRGLEDYWCIIVVEPIDNLMISEPTGSI